MQTIYSSVLESVKHVSMFLIEFRLRRWKTSSGAIFCISIAINLSHIGTGINNVVHFKILNSPKSSCLAGESFHSI